MLDGFLMLYADIRVPLYSLPLTSSGNIFFCFHAVDDFGGDATMLRFSPK